MSERNNSEPSGLQSKAVAFLPGDLEPGQTLDQAPPYIDLTPWTSVKPDQFVEAIEEEGQRYRRCAYLAKSALSEHELVVGPRPEIESIHDALLNRVLPRNEFPRGAAEFTFDPTLKGAIPDDLKKDSYFFIHDIAIVTNDGSDPHVHSIIELNQEPGFYSNDQYAS